ncbi:MAG: SDR family oxidoreductase [Acidimicrobiales bacterium]|nr:SDR family oxidoreductase [Acidimicrobiales bacterium]
MGRLDDKVVIITGGARGQGAATGALFAAEGAVVVLTDVDDAEGEAAAVAAGHGAVYVHHDVTDPADWARLVHGVVADHGRVDGLVNNAGIIEWHSMTTTPLDVWERVIAVNQTGPFLGMQAVAPIMIRQGSGSIVNISSVGGLGGSSPCYAYGATKWALRGMTRGAAQELGPHGIRVNAVLPGTIESRMIADMNRDAVVAGIPLGRVAEPVEVAKLSLWLISDDSAYVSGADHLIDGGMRA